MADIDSPYPDSLGKLVEVFARLPGVGKRSAERMAFYFLKCGKEEAMDFAFAIRDLRKNLRSCTICFNLAEGEICAICSNPARDDSQLCVVEMPRDVIAIEKTGSYRGLYHVILGRISPIEGIEPDDLKIKELFIRIENGDFEEIIIATNPTAEGDATASYLADKIHPLNIKVSRLARGISAGTEIEFAGLANLQSAFLGRSKI